MDEKELKEFVKGNDFVADAMRTMAAEPGVRAKLNNLLDIPLGVMMDKLDNIVVDFINSPACEMEDWEKLSNKNAIKDITGGVMIVAGGVQDLSPAVSSTLMDSALKAMCQMFVGLGETPEYQENMGKLMDKIMDDVAKSKEKLADSMMEAFEQNTKGQD